MPRQCLHGGWICYFAAKLSPRWHRPSHLHLNGSVEAHLPPSFLRPDRPNKSQWADENRKTSLLCYTNSICSAQRGCTRPPYSYFICSSAASRPLTIWVNYKVPCSPSFFAEHLARASVMLINLHLQFFIGSATSIKYYFRTNKGESPPLVCLCLKAQVFPAWIPLW